MLFRHVLLYAISFIAIPDAFADAERFTVIEIRQIDTNTYEVLSRSSGTFAAANRPDIQFPASCEEHSRQRAPDIGSDTTITYACSEDIGGEQILIRYPYGSPLSPILVTFSDRNGADHVSVLGAGDASWSVPLAYEDTHWFVKYGQLGFEHIWDGLDHLLFLVCLVWLASSLRRLVLAVTGFTIAHSLTLGLSVLGFLQLPNRFTEAVIALSIVFIALEIARNNHNTLSWRYPILTSCLIGLVHGLGFASILIEAGLTPEIRTVALVSFNIGIEIGQIVFVTLTYLVIHLVRRMQHSIEGIASKSVSALRISTSYMCGSVGVYWFMDRALA